MRYVRLSIGSCVALLIVALSAAAQDESAKKQKEIAELISQLGADDYHARQRAQDKLGELGAEAFDALAAAQNDKDIEIASRARFLLRSIRVELVRETDAPAVKEQLRDYAASDEKTRLKKIAMLSRLAADGGLEALCRLVRFESSEALSKQAAIHVLNQTVPTSADWKARGDAITAGVGASQRAGARWLRAYVDAKGGKAEEAAKAWAAFSDEEAATLRRLPQQTHIDVVIALLRYRVSLLDGLKRRDEAAAAFRQLVDIYPDKSEKVIELVDWIRTQKAWAALADVEKRFKEMLEKDAVLVYALATAREAEGNAKLADELAAKAVAMHPGDHLAHLRAAATLQQRGMTSWSEREYRIVIALPPADNLRAMQASYWLSEMLHDRGGEENELKAGKVLENAVAAMKRNIAAGKEDQNYQRDPASVTARMHYFYAMHHQAKDMAKHIEHLDKAIAADPTDADALIALYRLPKQDDARKAKTLKLIEEAANAFRQQIKDAPDNDTAATANNQFAWLISNTEGDYQEALRCSQKSLEIKANTAAYLDTLGRCYYAVRDYQNAIKHQRMALELDPHSGQMRRQLQLFEKAAEETGKKP
jgi:tetratricopeptide (TPR) repeat protein